MLRVRNTAGMSHLLPALAVAISIAALSISRVAGWSTVLILLLAITTLALIHDVEILLLIRRKHREESRVKPDFANVTQPESVLLLELQRRADATILKGGTMKSALEFILTELREVVPFDSAQALLLVAPGRLSPMAEVGPVGLRSNNTLPVELTFDQAPAIAQVCASRRPLLISEVNQGRLKGMRTDIGSWMGVPVVSGARLFGVLSLSARAASRFSEQHLLRADAIANSVALAIEHSRLQERLEICSAELEHCLAASRLRHNH